MQDNKIAVSHADSVLAEAVLECLQLQNVSAEQLVLLGSEDQRGTRIAYGDTYLITGDQASFDYSTCRLLLLLERDVALENLARAEGCFILGNVDDESQPLGFMGTSVAEPEIRYGADSVRLPRAETCSVLDALKVISGVAQISRLQLTYLQSAGRQGKAGVEELASQTINLLNTREIKPVVFPEQIAFNLISDASEPQVANELAELLDLPVGCIAQNTIMTPVFYGLAVSVVVQFDTAIDIDAMSTALSKLEDLQVRSGSGSVVSDCNQSFSCVISQIQATPGDSPTLCFWLMADPHRYGLARNYARLSGFLQNSYL